MSWFIEALRKYAVFSGRSRRKEYWIFVLFVVIISIVLTTIDGLIGAYDRSTGVGLLSTIFSQAILIPSISVSVRRLHDIDRTGWWVLISLVPLVGWIVLLVFHVQDSTPSTNRYGPNPKSTEYQSMTAQTQSARMWASSSSPVSPSVSGRTSRPTYS